MLLGILISFSLFLLPNFFSCVCPAFKPFSTTFPPKNPITPTLSYSIMPPVIMRLTSPFPPMLPCSFYHSMPLNSIPLSAFGATSKNALLGVLFLTASPFSVPSQTSSKPIHLKPFIPLLPFPSFALLLLRPRLLPLDSFPFYALFSFLVGINCRNSSATFMVTPLGLLFFSCPTHECPSRCVISLLICFFPYMKLSHGPIHLGPVRVTQDSLLLQKKVPSLFGLESSAIVLKQQCDFSVLVL